MKMMRTMIATALTSTMIATAAFGTVAENPLSQQFQEVIDENIPVEVLAPLNQALEQAGLPTVPASQSIETLYQDDGKPAPTFLDAVMQVASGEILFVPNPDTGPSEQEQTAIPAESSTTAPLTATASLTNSPSPTLTTSTTVSLTPTVTQTPTVSDTPSATATFFLASPTHSPSRTKKPTETWTPTATPSTTFTPTLTFTPTETIAATATPSETITATNTVEPTQAPPPEGFIIWNISLNGGGSSTNTTPGGSVNVTYDFQIYSLDACPGCIVQLVTGLGSPGSHGGSCPFDGGPGSYPGSLGSENTTLLAPDAAGSYDVFVVYTWEYTCSGALQNYPNGVLSLVIGQITVSP